MKCYFFLLLFYVTLLIRVIFRYILIQRYCSLIFIKRDPSVFSSFLAKDQYCMYLVCKEIQSSTGLICLKTPIGQSLFVGRA